MGFISSFSLRNISVWKIIPRKVWFFSGICKFWVNMLTHFYAPKFSRQFLRKPFLQPPLRKFRSNCENLLLIFGNNLYFLFKSLFFRKWSTKLVKFSFGNPARRYRLKVDSNKQGNYFQSFPAKTFIDRSEFKFWRCWMLKLIILKMYKVQSL